ncbi:hypothetical protein RHGRI_001677 [Rhododendron griersonianum]|uniref:Receptor-like serine/threonine-protein kinase n=1 Tax=Rhododendron griersonianum TaxID=479676 RepID=A0AAV6LM52_9ERIC|nr:hypothetical protein RHGRI_001677 [Rhododendron griersonianum]
MSPSITIFVFLLLLLISTTTQLDSTLNLSNKSSNPSNGLEKTKSRAGGAPARNLSSAAAVITADGELAVELGGGEVVWTTGNAAAVEAVEARLLEEGNLVLVGGDGGVVWRSFDFPADTWLPGMNLTGDRFLTSWRGFGDPGVGKYSLRLKPPEYGEVELVFDGTESFHFTNPFKPTASFGYTETSLESGVRPPLTRFHLDTSGQLRQYTWSPQAENWNMFWSQPENLCTVYGHCGNFGFCNARLLTPCNCIANFQPVDSGAWDSGDFSSGCCPQDAAKCSSDDGFQEVGVVSFDGAVSESFSGGRSECDSTCLSNCSCVGLIHNSRTNLCKALFGSLLNLKNLTSDSTNDDILYIRVPKEGVTKKKKKRTMILIGKIGGIVVVISAVMVVVALLFLRRIRIKRVKREKEEEDAVFLVTNLKVFSYEELHAATRGFSEKLGHGGFGAVFLGKLPGSSSSVAVKRLERPGGAEREFRAEVCTIGNIQHVNLVRLRGFCSENSHRLLVYDYMPKGPLSMYLKRNEQNLSWDVRFRIAVGTARAIAYLHEGCRDCIIHCDIKPENILLSEDFSPKVSDFGLAKLVGRDISGVLATMRGTWGYVAPEWISGVAITAKADVYSYGMTLLELIGGRRNVVRPLSGGGGGGGGEGEKWFFPPWAAKRIIEGDVAAVVDERLVAGGYDVVEAERVGLVAVWCIQDEEGRRPTMGMVVKMLEGVVEVGVPPPPKLLQALVSGESFHGVGSDSGTGESDRGNSVDSHNHSSTAE